MHRYAFYSRRATQVLLRVLEREHRHKADALAPAVASVEVGLDIELIVAERLVAPDDAEKEACARRRRVEVAHLRRILVNRNQVGRERARRLQC